MQLVIGAGQAGYWASRTLRETGYTGPLVLLGSEPHLPYERPPLSKQVLLGYAPPASTALTTNEALAGLAVDWRPNLTVREIDRRRQRILTNDGELAYDQLLLATGARNRKLDIEGCKARGVFSVRTLEDSMALGAALRMGGDVVVIGAGWIGLEAAAAACMSGLNVTVADMADRICIRSLPEALSRDLQREHEERGVRFRLGAGVGRSKVSMDGLRGFD